MAEPAQPPMVPATMNTHVAVIAFGGDFDADHPDEALRGRGPSLTLLAAGPEEFCWLTAAKWTERHPLQRDQHVEVLARDPQVVRDHRALAQAASDG